MQMVLERHVIETFERRSSGNDSRSMDSKDLKMLILAIVLPVLPLLVLWGAACMLSGTLPDLNPQDKQHRIPADPVRLKMVETLIQKNLDDDFPHDLK